MIRIAADKLQTFCLKALACYKVRPDVSKHVAESLVQASLRGVDSHGVRLLPHYLRAIEAGRLNTYPAYRFERTAAGAGRLDGGHTFGHAAGAEAMKHAIELAQEAGVGAVAVSHSSHFGATAYFALMAAEKDMIGLSFTHGDSLILTPGGRRRFFGANTLCLAAPCEGEEPFCLDMAASVTTWNKILQLGRQGQSIPLGWGADGEGNDTQDAGRIVALHPIGGYKGFGLAMAVEILCSLLTGVPFGCHIVRMYDDPLEKKRNLGHFFLAIRIGCLVPVREFKLRMREMMEEIRAEPPKDAGTPIQVPGDPEKRMKAERSQLGIPFDAAQWTSLRELAARHGLECPHPMKEKA